MQSLAVAPHQTSRALAVLGVTAGIKTGAERVAELRQLSEKKSRTALVSGGLEPVYAGGWDGHSVFTRALLTALRENTGILDGSISWPLRWAEI